MNIQSTFKAVLISPWASLVFVAFMVLESVFASSPGAPTPISGPITGTIIVLFMFTIGYVGTSYLIVVSAGLPLHWLLCRLGISHWSIYLCVGIVIGLVWQFVSLIGSEMPWSLQSVGYISYGVCAAVVSLVFWYIAVKSHNNSLKLDGPDGPPT